MEPYRFPHIAVRSRSGLHNFSPFLTMLLLDGINPRPQKQ
uniref:Uncharacterized protein n=1 Tax=Anopheles arabiensis TaxID=7173 RepID=A0A182IH35_ANOAR